MNLIFILFSLIKIIAGSNDQLTPFIISANNSSAVINNFYQGKIDLKKNTNNADSTLPNYKKLAVLVGVDDYKYVRPLSTSVNSVKDLAANLKAHGYDTMVYLNISQSNFMVHGMRGISAKHKAENYDVILFYLSGHFDAVNQDELFFLTADCNPNGDRNNYFVQGTIHLYNLATRIMNMKPKIGMLLLDGPNNNELPGGSDGKYYINEFMNTPRSGLLTGSCFINYQSQGNSGPISLYADAIINSLNTPDVNLKQAFDNVNNYVSQKTGGKVTPSYKSGITSSFCFSCK